MKFTGDERLRPFQMLAMKTLPDDTILYSGPSDELLDIHAEGDYISISPFPSCKIERINIPDDSSNMVIVFDELYVAFYRHTINYRIKFT